jgi:hypothetical protein
LSRKYRQQGYQDSDRTRERDERKPRPPDNLTPEERIQRRSLRHATAREASEVIRCHVCGRSIQDFGTITQSATCPYCSAELHCCRTCTNFDSSARWQCRADITEPISDKSKANACARYAPRLVLDATGRRAETPGAKSDDPKSRFESLFKR